MAPDADHAPSIRRRLLTLLVLPVTAVLFAGALVDYVSSLEALRDSYDEAPAHVLSSGGADAQAESVTVADTSWSSASSSVSSGSACAWR
jgi:hypothetical protein